VGSLCVQAAFGHLTLSDVWVGAPFALFSVVGALIASRRPGNAVGWLCCIVGVGLGFFELTGAYAELSFKEGAGETGPVVAAAWLTGFGAVVGIGTGLTLLPLTFPTGRLPSRRWRPIAWLAVGAIAAAVVGVALYPGVMNEDVPVRNPFGLTAAEPLLPVSILVIGCLSLSCVASLIVRYRTADETERLQIKWLLAAMLSVLLAVTIETVLGVAGIRIGVFGAIVEVLAVAAVLSVPCAIGVAVLRHRLLDIDLIVSRGTVYLLLTVCVVAGYFGCVAVLVALSGGEHGAAASVIATGVVALVFAPLRHGIQRRVDRYVYGERGDPYAVVSRLGRRLEEADTSEPLLRGIVDTIAASLRLPYVAIEDADGTPVAAHGDHHGHIVRLPLTHGTLTVGHLAVSPRTPGEQLAAADRRLLDDVARLAALAAQSVALAEDLRASRERIVADREEELRRLRRELHDGLGPTLAGVALQLEAGRRRFGADPGVDAMLASIRLELQSAMADVRRTAYNLRPPALDNLGLVEALRRRADHLGAGCVASVDADEPFGELPAAVEAAAFRIASEALANCALHAAAHTCRVSIHCYDHKLELEIVDDGQGMAPGHRRGVGLIAMQERAAELGGCARSTAPSAAAPASPHAFR